jgi:hypothetical protein
MKYLKLNAALEVTETSDDYPIKSWGDWQWGLQADGTISAGWISKQDIGEHPTPRLFAQHLADSASKIGDRHILICNSADSRYGYSIARAPAIGDPVSMSFNGDSYPCGTIAKISKNLRRVETTERKVFYRRQETGRWLYGGWALINGHIREQNPHF